MFASVRKCEKARATGTADVDRQIAQQRPRSSIELAAAAIAVRAPWRGRVPARRGRRAPPPPARAHDVRPAARRAAARRLAAAYAGRRTRAAAARNLLTSSSVRLRHAPGLSLGSLSGPMATRRSWFTGCPIASHIFRTWRLRPSRTVMRSVAPDALAARRHQLDVGRLRAAPVDDDAARSRSRSCASGTPSDARLIHARDAVARVREPRGEIAVVGEHQQPFDS